MYLHVGISPLYLFRVAVIRFGKKACLFCTLHNAIQSPSSIDGVKLYTLQKIKLIRQHIRLYRRKSRGLIVVTREGLSREK